MPTTETPEAPPSQETPRAAISDAKKSGNVKGHSAALELLRREATAAAPKAPPAESIAAAKPAEPASTAPAAAEKAVASEPEAKAPETKPEETKAEDPEVLSKSIPPEIQESINKRIGKEIAKREALEQKLADLEKKFSEKPLEVPTPAAEPTTANPLADVADLASLEKRLSTARETKLWCQEQLDREDIDQGVKVGERSYTKQELKTALRNVERMLDIHIPERARYLNARANSAKAAVDTFEWLKDTESDQYKAFVKVAQDPALGFAAAPNGIYAAAAAVEGQNAVQLRKAIAKDHQGTKPVERKAPPQSQLAGSGASVPPAREPGSSRAVAALAQEMEGMKKGHGVKVRDVTAFLARRDQLHR